MERRSPPARMTADLLRKSLKLAVATLLTAALAEHFDRIQYVWYPLLAVVIVVDDNDAHTLQAASGRILGTVVGGLVTFLVHNIASGWPGVLLSLLLMVPLLRLLGWQSAVSTACLISIIFLMIPSHAALNWDYAFNRALDTAVGCAVAVGVGLLFWPRDGHRELAATEERLLELLADQLRAYRRWLAGEVPRPQPLRPAPLSGGVERLETLLSQELAGSPWQRRRAAGWRQRVALWQSVRLHWVQWERLLAATDPPAPSRSAPIDPLRDAIEALAAQFAACAPPDPAVAPLPSAPPPTSTLDDWIQLAHALDRPLLPLLALARELTPLLASGRQLVALRAAPPCP